MLPTIMGYGYIYIYYSPTSVDSRDDPPGPGKNVNDVVDATATMIRGVDEIRSTADGSMDSSGNSSQMVKCLVTEMVYDGFYPPSLATRAFLLLI